MSEYISFPNLGWKFDISSVLVEFQLFGISFSIKWYGLIIAVGFLVAMIYALKRAKSFDIDPDRMIDVVLVSALFAFLGARLYYVLFSKDLADYLADPVSILQVWNGGLAIYGGVIMAFVTTFWMCRVRKVNVLAMFDMGALGLLIGQGIGRWGNFFNQEAFGSNTNLPWAMTGSIIEYSSYNLDGTPVHPTFLYESLWCLLGLVILHLVSKKAYKFKGQIFAMYLMWYGVGRFAIESLRTDSLYLGTMKVSQLVAVLSIIGGLSMYFFFKNRAAQLPKDLFAPATISMEQTDGEDLETGELSEDEEDDSDEGSDDEFADEDDGELTEEDTIATEENTDKAHESTEQ